MRPGVVVDHMVSLDPLAPPRAHAEVVNCIVRAVVDEVADAEAHEERIDEDSWHPHLYDFSQPEVADQWGTANQMDEFVARKSFNEPDRGLFTAPPV